MSETNLKLKATKGILWNAVDKFAVQSWQFVIGIVLARLLIPEDFGLIGMLSIFIAISQTFVESGMGSGLIQKKNSTDLDFSTVFVFNFIVSLFFYLILFFTAPLIADFYKVPQLVLLTRVLAINIVINSLSIIQRSKLTINIDFKTIAKVNAFSIFTGGILAVFFAYRGCGVWSLVILNISNAITSTIMFWWFSKWQPSVRFSKQSFKDLFGFGSKLLVSGLLAQAFNNVYNITIGKVYPVASLGFYTKTKEFAEITSGVITSILQQVTYPILASIQGEKDRMIAVFKRLIRISAFFIFPSMTLLALLADPFIRLILTEKWLPIVPLLQWMCFSRIFFPMSAINLNILNAIGRSDLFLKVDISKIPMAIIALIITIPMGIKAMIIGHVITSFLAFFINAYMPGKLFGYGSFKQLKDILPIVLATFIMAVFVFLITSIFNVIWLKLCIGLIAGPIVYYTFARLFKMQEINDIHDLFQKKILKKKQQKSKP